MERIFGAKTCAIHIDLFVQNVEKKARERERRIYTRIIIQRKAFERHTYQINTRNYCTFNNGSSYINTDFL